jgi:[protein-PII] uridylyltransferase
MPQSTMRPENLVDERRQFARETGEALAAERASAFHALAPASSAAVMRTYVAAVDTAVRRTYRWAFARAAEATGLAWDERLAEVAIIAVGGYGRWRLAPYSDVDIAVVVADETSPLVRTAIRHAYHILIDALHGPLGVEDGYAFYDLSHPLALDERTLSALLDSRLVAGNLDLARALDEEVFRRLDPPHFLRWNYEVRQEARRRAGGVIYLQEPNVKESPGGLRDLQCALWSAAAVWRRKPADLLSYLVERRELAEDQAVAARRAHNFQWAVRSWLHLSAGRKRDVIALESHLPAAEALGFRGEDGRPSPSALMAAYYREAETTEQLSRLIFGRCEAARVGVGDGFYVRERTLWTRNAPRVEKSAAAAMRAFELVQRYDLTLSRPLAICLERGAATVAGGRDSAAAAASFLAILRAGPAAARTLRLMQATGVLQAYIPEFELAIRWSSGEPIHEYTVGEHLLQTLEHLEVLTQGEAGDFESHALVYSELDQPEILVLAALLHDVGRIDPSRDHCHVGEEIARRTARRIGLPAEGVEAVARLVRRHLLLDRVATLRDVSEERTIHHVAERVGTVETLRRLYLLTCADVMAVGSGLWTDVRRDQLEDLYYRVLSHLLDDSPTRATKRDVDRLRRRALETLLRSDRLSAGVVRDHCRAMPDSYFLGTPVGLIGVHVSLVERLASEPTVIDFYDERGTRYTELTVCRYDDARPGLFARLCAALYANDVDIHDARIYTRPGDPPIALDTLWVTSKRHQVPEKEAQAIREDLIAVLDGGLAAEELLRSKERPRPACLHLRNLAADNTASGSQTVFEVEGRDQLGFLYCVSAALSSLGLNIHTAKITTRGTTAEDAFYVTNDVAAKLTDDEAAEAARALHDLLGCRDDAQKAP